MTQQKQKKEEEEGKKWDQRASWLRTGSTPRLERGSLHKKSSFTFAPMYLLFSHKLSKTCVSVLYHLSVAIWFAKDQHSMGCGECLL